jgi:hypothetical protein
MRVLTVIAFTSVLGGISSPLFAFRGSLGGMLTQSGCRACHPNVAPMTPASGGFAVIDPSTNSPVTRFEPGKQYVLRVHFTPVSATAPYVVGYKMEVYNGRSQSAGQILDAPIGPVNAQGNDTTPDRRHIPTPSTIARIVYTNQIAQAQTVSLNWRAPTDATSPVVFNLWRLETNANGASGGDRGTGSQAEIFTLLAPEGSGGSPPDGDDTGSTGPEVPDPTNTYSFSGDLGGGCGIMRAGDSLHSVYLLQIFGLTIMGIFLLILLRPSKKRGADFSAPLKD